MRKIGVATLGLFLLSSVQANAQGPALTAASIETEIAIDQNKAIAGGITPGDNPGFPITLSQAGRYVLKSNLYPPANTDGIEIKSHDITIDFNGFRLHGFSQAGVGIRSADPLQPFDTVAIMNGVVAGFKDHAIRGGNFWTVENMRVLVNGGVGILLGQWARVQRNTVGFNQIGIDCWEGCLVQDNNVTSNRTVGIAVRNMGTVLGNTITNNVSVGIQAFTNQPGSPITVGFGNNTLVGNNQGNSQVQSATPLVPNLCRPDVNC
jgi:hypothetical protein